MNFLRILFSAMVHYSFYAFVLISLVVSLVSGFADVIYHSRSVSARKEWIQEAEAEWEEFVEVDYTPNLITGISAFVMFAAASVLAVFFFMKKFDARTHILVITVTALAAFIFFLPRPPIGTGTEGMKEVFAYVMLLGIIDSSLYRAWLPDNSPSDD